MDSENNDSCQDPTETENVDISAEVKRSKSPEAPKIQLKSKRGRPRKHVNYSDLDAGSSLPFLDEDTDMIPIKRSYVKRAEPKAEEAPQPEESRETVPTPEENSPEPKKYKYTGETVKMLDTLFNFIATNDKLNVDNSEAEIDDKKLISGITCAICRQRMEKNVWSHHKQRYHNNLAWKDGETPLDLTDKSFVMATLNALYKKKKPLYCKCGVAKKSVVGFLSHQASCQKSEEQLEDVKVACELCGKKILPVSMVTHIKLVHSKPKEVMLEESGNQGDATKSDRRSAARKALDIITQNASSLASAHFTTDLSDGKIVTDILERNLAENNIFTCHFACGFTAQDLVEAVNHFKSCDKKPLRGFMCKYCLTVERDRIDIRKHLESIHEVYVESDDKSREYTVSEKHSSNKQPDFVACESFSKHHLWYHPAWKWTQQFQDEHYSDLVHASLKPRLSHWNLLPFRVALHYLPKLDQSCRFSTRAATSFVNPHGKQFELPVEWHSLRLFESDLHEDGKVTLFCGAPVVSMAWMPTPHKKSDSSEMNNEINDKIKELINDQINDQIYNQVLAVSTLNHPDDLFETTANYTESGCIQFWSFGCLNNGVELRETPRIVLNLCHDHGPVWDLEWCPSGCFNEGAETEARAGLLAATGADGVVYVYAIPFFTTEMSGLCYKPKPICKLLLQRPGSNLYGGVQCYPTKISWTKSLGHRYIAVGYSNGFVALFDLNLESCLTKYVDMDNVTCYLPVKNFAAHVHSISGLVLSPLNGGCRWLVSSSIDRVVNLWDLENHSYPKDTLKKVVISDLVWPIHWLCYATASDETSTFGSQVSCTLKTARDFASEHNLSLTNTFSTVSSLSFSDWHNAFVHGTTTGEIIAAFPHQLFNISEANVKLVRKRRTLCGSCYTFDVTKTSEERLKSEKTREKLFKNVSRSQRGITIKMSQIASDLVLEQEPITYQDAVDRYALLFFDNPTASDGDFFTDNNKVPTGLKHFRVPKPDQYPINAVSKIAFNPNSQASAFYATGYQAGFIRLAFMKFTQDSANT